MSNAVWSARHENKINTIEQLKKIKLNTDDAGQYQHNDVIKFIEQLKQVAKEQFNPLDKTNGMSKLFDKNQNTLNTITMQDAYDCNNILKKSRDEAFKASTKKITVKPDIMTRQEAQDEADRLNQTYQAVLGVKEGFKEKICDSGGTDALFLVLQQADRQNKSIDDYTLYELAEARITGAHRPKATHILKQIVSAITMQFDFRKKVMENVVLQKILVNKATAFGVTVHVSLLIVNLEANMEYAQSHKWGANSESVDKPSARSTQTTRTNTARRRTTTW
jgi:Asp-tRNA(Asn)/Glu-tRNA(Gln) amidotransferase C subunit